MYDSTALLHPPEGINGCASLYRILRGEILKALPFWAIEIREVPWRSICGNSGKPRACRRKELAHRAEINRTYISALERSVYAAGIDVVDRLARALGVEAADLLTRPSPGNDKKKGRSQSGT
jgi:helix-turn-helix protein